MFICISGTSGSVNTFQHREPEEESDSDSDDDLAGVRKRMRLENLIKHVDADVARELTAEIVNIFKEVKSTVATEIESLHEKVDALQNQMKEVREGVKWIGSKLKKKNGGIEQGNNAQQPEQEGQAIAPEPVAENVPQPARLNVEENAAVHNPREPRYITGGQCNDDQFLLGGRIGFVRSRQDYSELLHNVTKSGPYRDENERGKTLCLHLVRREFSNESLATKNATGQTKENRRTVAYPKLNEEVMRAIFDQARLQVTGFTDLPNSTNTTTKAINNICKKERSKRVAANEGLQQNNENHQPQQEQQDDQQEQEHLHDNNQPRQEVNDNQGGNQDNQQGNPGDRPVVVVEDGNRTYQNLP